jgi:hypothetical protein
MPKKSSKKAKSQRSRERALLEKVNLNAAGIEVVYVKFSKREIR